MEIKELLEKQKELDAAIMYRFYKNGGELSEEELIKDKIQALQSEVNEFSDQLGLYKYWKQNKEVDETKEIEEFVDILFFWLSIANVMGYSEDNLIKAYTDKWQENINRQKNNY